MGPSVDWIGARTIKICIFGAGAIGGYVGARLALAGYDVSFVARGAHGDAIRARGLRLLCSGAERICRLPCTDEPAALGPQDYVIVTLKAPAVASAVDSIAALLADHAAVVTAGNGIPYWYFHAAGGPYQDRRIDAVDPDGRQWSRLGPERAVGCVVHAACEVPEPGVVTVLERGRFILGEPSGRDTQRVQALVRAFREAGLEALATDRIRDAIWFKLWGNAAFNPISALTGATLEAICRDPGARGVARAIMAETQAIAASLDVRLPLDIDHRITVAEAVGAHKTSMLQDLERGRPLELDALVSSVQELGRLVGVATPVLDMVLALVTLRARQAGCYPCA